MIIRDIEHINDSTTGLVYIHADWCKHCVEVHDDVVAMSEKMPETNFYFLDFDEPEVEAFMNDSEFVGIPFFMVVEDGEVLMHSAGVDGEKEEFFAELESLLNS